MNDSGSKQLGKIRPLSFAGHFADADSSSLRRIIIIRLVIVGLLVIVRGLTVLFTPDLFIEPDVFGGGPDVMVMYPISGTVLIRIIIVISIGLGYYLSLRYRRYLSEISTLAMVFGCAVLWSDLELYIFAQLVSLTTLALGLLVMRVIIVALLILNYLDIHR